MVLRLVEPRWQPARRALEVLVYPCVLALMPSVLAYKSIQKTLRHRRQWPKPLPRRQRRRKVKLATTVEHVSNAGLFARLPYELRLQIYEYVLGGRQINIVQCPRKRRLAHRCQLHDPTNPKENERNAENQCSEEHWTDPPCNLALLLRTCRLIYTEAAEVLYTKNSFGVYGLQDLASFVCFSRTSRPERLASIKTLTVMVENWQRVAAQEKDIHRELYAIHSTLQGISRDHPRFTYPHTRFRDPDRAYPWRQLWRIVKEEMTGLKFLNVRFIVLGPGVIPLTPLFTADWVLPIREVPGVEKFSVRKLQVTADREQTMMETDLAIVEGQIQRELYSKPRLVGGRGSATSRKGVMRLLETA